MPSPPAGFLSANEDVRGFGALGNRLSDHLTVLQRLNEQMAAVLRHGTSLAAERDRLTEICSRLADSSPRLQALGLRVAAVLELGLDLAAERDMHRLLEVFYRGARNIMSARYAAVGILNVDSTGDSPVPLDDPPDGTASGVGRETGARSGTQPTPVLSGESPALPGYLNAGGQTLRYFLTKGLSVDQREELGQPPPRAGLFRQLLEQDQPMRLSDLADNLEKVGLAASHPPISNFLGVRIATVGRCTAGFTLQTNSARTNLARTTRRVSTRKVIACSAPSARRPGAWAI